MNITAHIYLKAVIGTALLVLSIGCADTQSELNETTKKYNDDWGDSYYGGSDGVGYGGSDGYYGGSDNTNYYGNSNNNNYGGSDGYYGGSDGNGSNNNYGGSDGYYGGSDGNGSNNNYGGSDDNGYYGDPNGGNGGATQPTNQNQNYNAQLGQRIASEARREANARNTTGYCYSAVADVIDRTVARFLYGASAYMAADQLAQRSEFVEISNQNLSGLPAGAVVVWSKGTSPHGHISIALGDGNEASDHIASQMLSHYGRGSARVFLPR